VFSLADGLIVQERRNTSKLAASELSW
jgi:hypothetical protein